MTFMDDPDEEPSPIPEAIRDAADVLGERFKDVPDELRKIGLYLEGEPQLVMVPSQMGPPRAALVAQFVIGRVAFSKRVQDPDTDQMNDQFRVMEVQAEDDAFLDERQRIADALARGEDPYAVTDEELSDEEG